MNIEIVGAADSRDGHGYITQEISIALARLGHNISIRPLSVWYHHDSLKEDVKKLINKSIGKLDFSLVIMYPVADFGRLSSKAAIICMYEAHKCPDVWTKRLNQLRLSILAPSKFAVEMFKNSNVTVPTFFLTLGIDSNFYTPAKRQFPEGRPFRFLAVGKLEPRKNVDVAVRCFQEAFSENEDVEFVIKTRERFLPNSVRQAAIKDKRIKIIEKTISEEEIRNLYYYGDSFIYPSRGEAWAFTPRNAISTGMPTLVTDWSALTEIPGAMKIKVKSLSPMFSCGFSYGQEKDLLMADIDETDLIEKMQRLANDRTFYNSVAKETFLVEQQTWEDSANNLVRWIEHGKI